MSEAFLLIVSTTVRAIRREAVAAGEGTFNTCSIFSDGTK
jgi:hypothetical protein